MALDKFVYIYSTDTCSFYNDKERAIHTKLLKLYKVRAKEKDGLKRDWKLKMLNRVIGKYKDKLIKELEETNSKGQPRELYQEALKEKNVINLFESTLTRSLGLKPKELSTDLMVVNVFFFQVLDSIVHHGFMYNGEKYRFLTASAGQIRQKKFVAIKESAYERIKLTLMCGLTEESINEHGGINTNKFLAYLALNGSATDVWDGFDIDKSIVVDDFQTDVIDTVDLVDAEYNITRKLTPVNIPHMDGCGIMLDKPTRMVRAPWVKGLLVYFPYDKFIEEYCGGECVVKDIYGQEHKIIEEGIKYIFTKSQFKLYKYYSSWDEYKENFKKYHCEISYCNIEDEKIPPARINYQMLQTLTDMTDDEIDKITRSTVKDINSIGADYRTNMRLLGADGFNTNKNYFQQALEIYPELFRDVYHREILKQTKASYIKQGKAGRLRVNGGYRFLSPDLYAFCEWLFLHDNNPKGLLENGEVFCEGFRDGSELACLRSPHLYREWAIRKNKKTDELKKWFDTKCIYTSCHDTISKILQ